MKNTGKEEVKAAPNEKNAKMLDLSGRKIYSVVGLQIHIAKYQAHLA